MTDQKAYREYIWCGVNEDVKLTVLFMPFIEMNDGCPQNSSETASAMRAPMGPLWANMSLGWVGMRGLPW